MVYIGFSTTTNPVSRAIRWFTKSKASHCFFVVKAFGNDLMIEASVKGFRVIGFAEWKKNKKHKLIAVVEPKVDMTSEFELLVPYLGHDYDFGGLIGMAIVTIGRWFGRKWNNPWDSSKSVFCSEVIAQVMVWAKYPGWTRDPSETSPEDLYQFFANER